MSEPMKKPLTRGKEREVFCMHYGNAVFEFPKKVAERYRVSEKNISADKVFAEINEKHTKPGALLKGIRVRENLTQIEMANILKMTQSDISQIENGRRSIGRKVAKRIEQLFDVDYRSFYS